MVAPGRDLRRRRAPLHLSGQDEPERISIKWNQRFLDIVVPAKALGYVQKGCGRGCE
jgi:hypothetical protein